MPTIPESSSAQGELRKLTIYAYNNIRMEDSQLADIPGVDNPYTALINPESYQIDIKFEFDTGQGQGTTGTTQKFKSKVPEEMTLDFLFDNTGIIDGQRKDNISDDVSKFILFLTDYDGEIHEPRFFKFAWGNDLFKVRCFGVNVTYKLFNPDGTPIRALCKVALKQCSDEGLRVRQQRDQSPDLTHYRVVKQGDTLPWMCYRIYGDPKYYMQVAAANQLTNFRALNDGQEIFFPPII